MPKFKSFAEFFASIAEAEITATERRPPVEVVGPDYPHEGNYAIPL